MISWFDRIFRQNKLLFTVNLDSRSCYFFAVYPGSRFRSFSLSSWLANWLFLDCYLRRLSSCSLDSWGEWSKLPLCFSNSLFYSLIGKWWYRNSCWSNTQVCWFILVSQTGQGGVISAFLSAEFWQPFSSLSFNVYLLHPLPILLYVASTKEIQQLDHFYLVRLLGRFSHIRQIRRRLFKEALKLSLLFQAIFFFGIWSLSHVLAYVAHLTVELPFAGLEKLHKSTQSDQNLFPSKQSAPALGNFRSNLSTNHVNTTCPTLLREDQHFDFDSGIVAKYKFWASRNVGRVEIKSWEALKLGLSATNLSSIIDSLSFLLLFDKNPRKFWI